MSKIKRLFVLVFSVIMVCCAFTFTACESVVPCAWTYLKMDSGYVVYTSYMYASGGSHILYYKNEEDAGDKNNAEITISFYPRCMSSEPREIGGQTIKTILVDVSRKPDMSFYVYKNTEIYSPEKTVYVNGVAIDPVNIYDCEYFVSYLFENMDFKRGNPGGRINNEINVIEYR